MNKPEPNSPCRDQSEKSIKKWLHSNAKVGALVVIRRFQDGMLQYERAKVLSIRPKNLNIGTLQSDGTFTQSVATFDHSGKNWGDPNGPTRIVMPTPAVLEACDACNFGTAFLPALSREFTFSVR